MNHHIIVRARKRAGLSQERCAFAAGMTRSHLSLVEKGRSGLSPERACRLVIVLGISLDDIYGVPVVVE